MSETPESSEGEIIKAVRWPPSGDGIPSKVTRLLAVDGMTWGYGYGPGWSMIFGSEQGDIVVQPGQWVVLHDDGRVTVEDSPPNKEE